ncbi:MAG: hypothetical protein ACKOC8_08070 [Pirellulales bacterium]
MKPPPVIRRRHGADVRSQPWAAWSPDHAAEGLAAVVAAVVGAAAVMCGVVLAMRRLTGGFTVAEPAVTWSVTAAFIALVAAADLAARGSGWHVAALAARAALILGVAAVALPPRSGDVASPAAVALAVGVAAWRTPRPRATSTAERPRRTAPPRRTPTAAEEPRRGRAERLPGRLVQTFERYESTDGVDCLRGRVTVAIPAGSKAAHAHLGFCPSFTATPSVTVSTEYDGVDAIVTAAEVLPWGVRVECRLTEPAEEPLEIPVDVHARAPL